MEMIPTRSKKHIQSHCQAFLRSREGRPFVDMIPSVDAKSERSRSESAPRRGRHSSKHEDLEKESRRSRRGRTPEKRSSRHEKEERSRRSFSEKPARKVRDKERKKELNTGKWSEEEHDRFRSAIRKYGRRWVKVTAMVETRSGPSVHSHAQ